MKKLTFLLCCIIVVFIFSCQSDKTDIKELVDKFADLECRAITLREKRFELANQMRFTQDTLLQITNKADTSRFNLKLAYYNKDKEAVLQQSLSLADSIRTALNDLMKNKLTKENDKAAFNKMLNETLLHRGCIKKS